MLVLLQTLLLGPCLQLATQRVGAIKEGKSVSDYAAKLIDGSESKEVLKPLIDEEVKAAKDAGLNFNCCAFIWLFDVGVTQQSSSAGKYRTPMGVVRTA